MLQWILAPTLGALALLLFVPLSATPVAAAAASASLDQCTNGPVGPPLSAQPCVGSNAAAVTVSVPGINGGTATSYKNWVNGNSNGAKAHWREGEFISYRASISGIGAGQHTLTLTYDTVHSGGHALDYLGSYDATETTSPATTSVNGAIIHANNNSPCQDLVLAGQMTPATCGSAYAGSGAQTSPATPVATTPAPLENFGSGTGGERSCGGAGGTWGGTQQPGTIDLFGPAGSTLGPATITSDNVPSGTGQCTSTVTLTFSVPAALTASQSVVVAWGAHIASQRDWGAGNSASFINGSPYHMALLSLDGASTGSQDRALATSAIFFTPTLSTTICNASNTTGCSALGSAAPLGTSAYDTSAFGTATASASAGGTVYYHFGTGTCTNTGTTTAGPGEASGWPQSVTVSNGSIPNSPATGSLGVGSYFFYAYYAGDGSDEPAVSPCEPFTVAQAPTTTATIVFDATTNAAWSGTEGPGASAYDTATVSGQQDGIVPTGTVNYSLFSDGACGTAITTLNGNAWPQKVTLTSSGSVPNSQATGPLTAGDYSFQAAYSGDGSYGASTGSCEPFSVAKGQTTLKTTVFDAGTGAAWSGTEATGASAYDTSTLSGQQDGIVPTGSVTYSLFTNDTCSGIAGSTQQVTVAPDGSVPGTTPTAALGAGKYSFQAVYSGDPNYAGSTGDCEPFTVGPGSSSTGTTVFDAGTGQQWSGTETTGASAYDTATVKPSDGFVPTGTVTYTFFTNGTCSGSGAGAGTVTLQPDGSVPNSNTEGPLAAGSYSFQAVYSGDPNYAGSTSDCEPFTVGPGTSSTGTTVFDAGTGQQWSGSETTGASAYDTATVTPSSGAIAATATVTYTFFTNGSCSGSGASAGTVTLDGSGNVPPSATEGPLPAGSYSFEAVYSGDGNYNGSTSACEPFNVAPGSATTATKVFDAGTSQQWSGSETTGATAYDTAAVTPSDGFVPTGTVTYTFFTNGTCSGSGSGIGIVQLGSDGSVPQSDTTTPLTAGDYSFQAVYTSGDSNYTGSTSDCEPFDVGPGSSTTATTVFDAGTGQQWSGTETTGASAYDTATVTPSDGFVATGTVTYTFFSEKSCSGTATSAGTVSLRPDGSVPDSAAEGPLTAGSYSFQAVYSGDGNYAGSTSDCEPFDVGPGSSTTATTVFDASTNKPWNGGEGTGATAYDTAAVAPSSSAIVATGTVTYTFFSNNTCTGTGTGAGTVTLDASDNVPNSNAEGPLAAGSYSFQATYSGDGNYAGSTSPCEPFSVVQVSQITPTSTTCQQFASGNAATLSVINYSTSGSTISTDNPGVIFYWVKVTVASAGTQTFHVTQSTTYSPATGTGSFALGSGSRAYDGQCNALTTTISGTDANRVVTFSAAAAGTYYIGLKYSTKSVVGTGPAATSFTAPYNYLYTFATTEAAGSTSTVELNHS